MGFTITDAFVLLFGYLLGSINPAIILSKMSGNGDVRDYGSGNDGTSNITRTLGIKYGIVTALFDIFKGWLAAYVGMRFLPADGVLLGGFAAMLGHRYPIFFGLKGGKCVATYGGSLLAVDIRIALCYLAAWAFFILVTRYMAMGAILGVWIVPFAGGWFLPEFQVFRIYAVAVGWIICSFHKKNFKRVKRGLEPKVTLKLHHKEEKYDV